jgi:hypothetical protein
MIVSPAIMIESQRLTSERHQLSLNKKARMIIDLLCLYLNLFDFQFLNLIKYAD